MMYKLGGEGSGKILHGSKRGSNQTAVRLLQEAGERVVGCEAMRARILQREQNHDRLVAAHDARGILAYRLALNGYVEAAHETYRKMNKEVRSDAL